MSELFTHVVRSPSYNINGKDFAPQPMHWIGNFEVNYFNYLESFLQKDATVFDIYKLDQLFIMYEHTFDWRKPITLICSGTKETNKRIINVLNQFFNQYQEVLTTLYALRMQELRETKRKV